MGDDVIETHKASKSQPKLTRHKNVWRKRKLSPCVLRTWWSPMEIYDLFITIANLKRKEKYTRTMWKEIW